MRVDNGKAEGRDYDALAEICKRLNCTPKFQEIAWDNLIAGVAQGQFDMELSTASPSPRTAPKPCHFSDGFISIDQRIMVKLDETRISKIDDFKLAG